MDLISRQAAMDIADDIRDCISVDGYWAWMERLKALPTADLSEYCDKLWKTAYERGKAEAHPKKGKWIDYCGDLKCDQCGCEADLFGIRGEWNYCPNCGARMEE